jgi:hypothetical protein
MPGNARPRPLDRRHHPRYAGGRADFPPAPRAASRYDGWTSDRPRAFVRGLAETGCVTRACAWVGMSNVAHLLRKGPGAEGFARARDEALAVGTEWLADIAYERAVYGVPVPVFHKGEQVGGEQVGEKRGTTTGC